MWQVSKIKLILRDFQGHNLHYEKFADGSVKCIEDEIPFELPEGWEWTRLANTVSNLTAVISPPAANEKPQQKQAIPSDTPPK